MNDKENTTYETETIECSECLKEIPVSEAKNVEGADYVAHFYGLECYEKWIKENPDKNKP